jgi:hydrogenase expression/formation protein HypE
MADTEHIQLAHGGGGQLMAELIEQVVLPALPGQQPGKLTDAATLAMDEGSIAFTTDSYVVQPLEFPGGDIGKLAVCGTINDLAVCGAEPVAISLSLVMAEGLEIALLKRVLCSAGCAAREAGVAIVTGDTKVMDRGSLDGLVINTSGIGRVNRKARLGFDRLQAGDRVLLSGPLGEHGLAVMSLRKGLSFSSGLKSDCAAIHRLTAELVERLGPGVRFMRDPTRGGLASALVEIAESSGRSLEIQEAAIPVNRSALAAAEILGLDLLTIANEGKLVAVVAPEAADEARAILSRHGIARCAAVIGTVCDAARPALVEMVTVAGGRRIVQMPYGEELPRIC